MWALGAVIRPDCGERSVAKPSRAASRWASRRALGKASSDQIWKRSPRPTTATHSVSPNCSQKLSGSTIRPGGVEGKLTHAANARWSPAPCESPLPNGSSSIRALVALEQGLAPALQAVGLDRGKSRTLHRSQPAQAMAHGGRAKLLRHDDAPLRVELFLEWSRRNTRFTPIPRTSP